MDFVILSQRVILPDGTRPAAVRVKDGRIASVGTPHDIPWDIPVIDVGNSALMAGVVDTHVHVNEPGRTEWEGYETATQAAAAGGITTLIDMPLNSIPVTTTVAALKVKQHAAKDHCWIDVGFWGGVVPGNTSELEGMIAQGVKGFKAFLTHSGIDDFPNVTEADLRIAMPILARHGVPLLVHAELEGELPNLVGMSSRSYGTFLASRPASWEVDAIRMMIRLCRETGCRVHIVHLSAADALPDLAAAKQEGLPITAETCPHYLVFAAEDIPDGATAFKCAPPIREAENRKRLWDGLRSGTLDFVACDHSPCTPGLKLPESGDFLRAWGGISSLQFSLPVLWTQARARGFTLDDLARWVCQRTAAFAGLDERKGAIAPGFDADFVVWNPDAVFLVDADRIRHRHPVTPYLGRALVGVVERTYLRGNPIHVSGVLDPIPMGKALLAPSMPTETIA
jgi:allantoinase